MRVRSEYQDGLAAGKVTAIESAYADGERVGGAYFTRESETQTCRLVLTADMKPASVNRWLVVDNGPNCLVIGVLAGEYRTEDGSMVLRAGEAGCFRWVGEKLDERKLEYFQPAELSYRDGFYQVRWSESDYGPFYVQILDVPKLKQMDRGAIYKTSKVILNIPLDPHELYPHQKAGYYGIFHPSCYFQE